MGRSTSYKNKLARKEQKYRRMLYADTGINSVPLSPNIMVCNTGLVSGFTEERLVEMFGRYGAINNIAMIPLRSYCFIQFKDTVSAQDAFNDIHGKLTISELKGPLYLLFTDSLPVMELTWDSDQNINGLDVLSDFINEEEELQLLKQLNCIFASDNHSGNTLKHRLVRHYGYAFCYDSNNIDRNCPLKENVPEEFHFIIHRLKLLKKYNICEDWFPDQLTVNHYQPGQGIPSHVDTHSAFDDVILSLSVGSDIVMEFKHLSGKRIPVLLPKRSLLIMKEESRYVWSHGITPRKHDIVPGNNGLTVQKRGERISFTFRKIRHGPCCCPYKQYCDSQQDKRSIELDEALASKLESIHVHKVYDNIAEHFSDTRHKSWPNVASFVRSLERGSILIDIGCGNGKYFGINGEIYEVGCDRSEKLMEICGNRGHQAVVCDCLRLPFRSESADACMSIAVIHHLATEERRIQAVREIARILKPNGRALIYVWAKEQKKNKEMSSYLKQIPKSRRKRMVETHDADSNDSVTVSEFPTNKSTADVNSSNIIGNTATENETIKLPVHISRTEFKHSDVFVSWKMKRDSKSTEDTESPTFLRYYHVFTENELESLCSSITNIKVIEQYYDQGNWCCIFQKLV